MQYKRRLVAGVTASGALLCLTLSADGYNIDQQQIASGIAMTVPQRVDELREKLNAGFRENEPVSKQIENIVQFFNFYNCLRPGWRNC